MAALRTVRRGQRSYYYLVHSYRWEGTLHKRQLYLGTDLPDEIGGKSRGLEHQVWEETWFGLFARIRDGYRRYQSQLPSSVREEEMRAFVVEFTYDTNRIEGSTLTLDDTRKVLERGLTPTSRPIRDVEETRNHAAVAARVLQDPVPLDLAHLLRWHREVFGGTKPQIAGRLRDYDVRIRGSRHLPPSGLEVRPMMLELLRWAARSRKTLNPVELAGAFHFRFEQIHPFGDGNGRIGRLAMNNLLAQARYPLLNIRYGRRRGYYSALEAASTAGDERPFLHWFFLRYSRENRPYLSIRA